MPHCPEFSLEILGMPALPAHIRCGGDGVLFMLPTLCPSCLTHGPHLGQLLVCSKPAAPRVGRCYNVLRKPGRLSVLHHQLVTGRGAGCSCRASMSPAALLPPAAIQLLLQLLLCSHLHSRCRGLGLRLRSLCLEASEPLLLLGKLLPHGLELSFLGRLVRHLVQEALQPAARWPAGIELLLLGIGVGPACKAGSLVGTRDGPPPTAPGSSRLDWSAVTRAGVFAMRRGGARS
mmetsp:Transcript_3592/g.11196  ORF Transcript_3592/g.11196 Transcript_3592/m.11196 type:complete len:233 (-) Transcript_3592:1286-1984(-)